jgi:hypothetical protein
VGVVASSAAISSTSSARLPAPFDRPSCPAWLLKDWLADKPPGEPVFPINRNDAARSLYMDLEAAGVDSATEFDFHSLRHSFVTQLVKGGASVKVCQTLARHADPKLTLNTYTHLTVHDVARGLEGLSHTIPTIGVLTGLTGTNGESGRTLEISSPGRPGTVPHGLSPLGESKTSHLTCRGARETSAGATRTAFSLCRVNDTRAAPHARPR